jgi:hypothetical protein
MRFDARFFHSAALYEEIFDDQNLQRERRGKRKGKRDWRTNAVAARAKPCAL